MKKTKEQMMTEFVQAIKNPSFNGKVDLYSFANTRNAMESILVEAEKQDISIDELAKRAKITKKQLERYINGKDFLTFEDLQKLCVALGLRFKVEIYSVKNL